MNMLLKRENPASQPWPPRCAIQAVAAPAIFQVTAAPIRAFISHAK
jgi:hypothetical protein